MNLVIYGISWYTMGNQVKYLKILKFSLNKKLLRIGILLLFPCLLYLYLFLDKNLNIKLFEKNLNQNGFLTSLKNDFSNLFILKKINLTGRYEANIDLIKNIVNVETNQDINLIRYKTKKLKVLLEELPWIKEVSIKKHLPDTISINIEEHKAFAIFNKNNKNFLLTDKGKIIYEIKNPSAYKLIQLEGSEVLSNIEDIKVFFKQNLFLNDKISKIKIYSNNRWDLTTKNGIVFKLPNQNKQTAVNQINKYINLENTEIVDLRFLDKKIYMKIKQNEIVMRKKN